MAASTSFSPNKSPAYVPLRQGFLDPSDGRFFVALARAQHEYKYLKRALRACFAKMATCDLLTTLFTLYNF